MTEMREVRPGSYRSRPVRRGSFVVRPNAIIQVPRNWWASITPELRAALAEKLKERGTATVPELARDLPEYEREAIRITLKECYEFSWTGESRVDEIEGYWWQVHELWHEGSRVPRPYGAWGLA